MFILESSYKNCLNPGLSVCQGQCLSQKVVEAPFAQFASFWLKIATFAL